MYSLKKSVFVLGCDLTENDSEGLFSKFSGTTLARLSQYILSELDS